MLETATANAQQTLDRIFALSADIRYAALYQDGTLTSRQRSSVLLGSASDSDSYEELLVNPAILILARQRGNIDCGVIDLPHGHVSGSSLTQILPGSSPLFSRTTPAASVRIWLRSGTELSLVSNEANTDFPAVDCAKLHLAAIKHALGIENPLQAGEGS